jgi:Tol biopolymer transport system component
LNLKTNQLTTLSGSEGMWYPGLSPDDGFIVALSDVMLFDVKTQKWTELTQTTAEHPAWSHDGKYVYFTSAESEPAFNRVQIKDHKLERGGQPERCEAPDIGKLRVLDRLGSR